MPQDGLAVSTQAPSEAAVPGLLCHWRADQFGAAWIDVTGAVDRASAPSLSRVLRQAQASACLVVLDLRDAALLDGFGGRVIAEAGIRSRSVGHQLAVVQGCGQPDVSLALADAPDVQACYLDAGQPAVQALLQLARTSALPRARAGCTSLRRHETLPAPS